MSEIPYRRLWASVLGLAIKDARQYLKRHKLRKYPHPSEVNSHDAATAIAWITDETNRVGGFDWVCSVMDIDAEMARQKILQPRMADKKLLDRLDEFGDDDVD